MKFLQNRSSAALSLPAGQSACRPSGFLWAFLALLLSAGSTVVTMAETASAEGEAPPAEELVVFVQAAADGTVAEALGAEHLPAIRDAASQLEIPVRLLDAAAGVPEEVRITPFLVFQSARGRAFFQGRYADAGKVKHFLRTSRAIPAPSEDLIKTDVAVREDGLSRVYAPIKLTDPAGDLGSDFDVADFRKRALKAIEAGFGAFKVQDRAVFGPSDRAFYMDFYPYIQPGANGGELFVSVALFSQFNCIEPVFRSSKALRGPMTRIDAVFERAVRVLEEEVTRQIAASPIGDGFDPIPSDVPRKSWSELGLELPKMAGSIDPGAAPRPLAEWPRRWKIAASEDTPRLIFRFPSPLERYSGEVREVAGSLVLPSSGELRQATGFVEAETASVTMGEASLDKAVHQKMIHIADFPTSRFTLDRFSPDTEDLSFGRPARLHAEGTFRLMGRDVPLDVRGDVEPVLGPDGEPRLRVRAAFDVRLSMPFGIAGPDGPEPARDTLKFFLDFHMEADPPAAP